MHSMQSVQLVRGREVDPGLGLSQQEINLARISAGRLHNVCRGSCVNRSDASLPSGENQTCCHLFVCHRLVSQETPEGRWTAKKQKKQKGVARLFKQKSFQEYFDRNQGNYTVTTAVCVYLVFVDFFGFLLVQSPSYGDQSPVLIQGNTTFG